MPKDYSVCDENENGKHGPLRMYADYEIENTHVAVECVACGETTGYAIANFENDLDWG